MSITTGTMIRFPTLLNPLRAVPFSTTTINVTLAIRKALRRYLGIEPALSEIS